MKNRTGKTKLAAWISAVCAAVPVFVAVPAYAEDIKIGDYIQMGTYYDEPILWRCVDIDENGPLMLSDKIICLKPFDAHTSENRTTGSHSGRGNDESNYWADSNMRSWLNSSADAGDVEWLCGNPPVESEEYYNAYDQEAGFLTNFTRAELNAVKKVKQKSLISSPEYNNGIYTAGTEPYCYNDNISEVVQNYDTAYAEYVTDKVFLLDVKQVNAVYNNSSILGKKYYIGEPTAQCVENSMYKDSSLAEGEKWNYWLRSPYYEYGSCVRYVYSDGTVCFRRGSDDYRGVRPAFYLDILSDDTMSGKGTQSAPYMIGNMEENINGENLSGESDGDSDKENYKDDSDRTGSDRAVYVVILVITILCAMAAVGGIFVLIRAISKNKRR